MAKYQLEQWQLKSWQSPTRWYSAELIQTLWGSWCVRQRWGGRSNARGNGQSVEVESYEEGVMVLEKTAKRRQQRGYEEVN